MRSPFFGYRAGVDDNGAELGVDLADVGNGMAGTGGAEHDIAGAEGALDAVVVVQDLTHHQVEQLAVCHMAVVADAAAGLQGDVGEEPALVVQLLGGCEVGDLDGAVAATHVLTVFLVAICCFSDHVADLLFWMAPL